MRKIIVSNIMSLDGYYAGPNQNALVLPMDEAFDEYNAERLRSADTMLLGAISYELFRSFWPPIAQDTTARPIEREISLLTSTTHKIVISDTLEKEQTGPWKEAQIIRRNAAHAELAELKQQPGQDILIFGSHILWNDLLAAGLIDELHIMIGNVVLGEGTRMFEGKLTDSLKLVEVRKFEGSDNVLVKYEVGVSA